jgi:DNA-binding cell septation regulator SpoVG
MKFCRSWGKKIIFSKRIFIVPAVCLGIIFFLGMATAQDITVTAVSIDNSAGRRMASITLNDLIKIDEILIYKKNDHESIKFPQYISSDGRSYPQVVILKEMLKENIEKAIVSGDFSLPQGYTGLEYKITRMSLLSGRTRLANVEIAFNQSVKIICGVMENKDGELWVGWPSRKENKTGWVKQVTVLKPAFRKMLEQEIITKYKAAKSEE